MHWQRLLIVWLIGLLSALYAASGSVGNRIFNQLKPSVFEIVTAIDASAPKASYGSGFVVSQKGYLVTNYHVVATALHRPKEYKIFLKEGDTLVSAEVVAIDVAHDLALIKAQRTFSKSISLRPRGSVPAIGDRIFSMGRPQDLNISIIEGTYNGALGNGPYERIHMSSPLNSGMSGGPTLDENAQVIGVNVAVLLSSQNISFAVPVRYVHDLIRPVLQSKKPIKVADVHKTINSQLVAVQAELSDRIHSSFAEQITVGKWKVPKPPKDLTCWTTNNDHSEKRYKSTRQGCYLPVGSYVKGGIYSGTYEIWYTTLSGNKINLWQFFTALNSFYNAGSAFRNIFLQLFMDHEFLTTHDCGAFKFTNRASILFQVNYCLQGYVKYPDLYNAEIKAVSMDRTKEALVVKTSFQGFKTDRWKQIVTQLLQGIRKEDNASR